MANQSKILTPRVVLQLLIFIVIIPLLPLVISGHWGWWEAWVYAVVNILGFAISRRLAARRNPDLIVERARMLQHSDAAGFDKVLAPLLGLAGLLMPLVAGLEALLGGQVEFNMAVKAAALVLILAGYALGSLALIENGYFSGVVRLQAERGQQVVSTGPYSRIRHPGYAGAIITYLGIPFWLDSVWTFLPVILSLVVLVIRTRLEDQFLHQKLPGYPEYAANVRWRLLPGIW